MATSCAASRLLPLDEVYEALKTADPVWLESTIRARWQARCALVNQNVTDLPQLPDIEKLQHSTIVTASATDHDITAPDDTTFFSKYIQHIKAHDWAATELGPMSSWPLQLRRIVNVCLHLPNAVAIWWGDEASAALGKDIHEVWQGLNTESDMFGMAMAETTKTGLPSHGKGCLFVQKHGSLAEVWASFTLLPVPGSSGNERFINIMVDHTKDVISERRATALISLQHRTAAITTLDELGRSELDALKPYSRDIPYAALYQVSSLELSRTSSDLRQGHSEQSIEWSLVGVLSASTASAELPACLDTAAAVSLFGTKFESALRTGEIQVLSSNGEPAFGHLWEQSAFHGLNDGCGSVLLIPVCQGQPRALTSFLVMGTNPHIVDDEDHRAFAGLLQHHLQIALNSLVSLENQRRLTWLDEKLDGARQDSKQIEARFHRMADRSPVAMFEVGADGELKYANDSWFEMTGHPRDQLAPMQWVNTIHPEDQGWFAETWGRLIAGETLHFEIRFAKRFVSDYYVDGRRLEGTTWAAASAYAERDEDGNVLNVLGTTADISRLKWLEDFQSRRATEALELKKQQEAFMDMISHEARNPLSAITLCAENSVSLLSQRAKPETSNEEATEAILDDLNTILACASHQESIIDDVLTLSKIKNSMLAVCPVPVQPSKIVLDTLTTFAASVSQSNLDVDFHTDPSCAALNIDWVLLDPVRVRQILMNLISNAVKFTKDKIGERRIDITLSAHRDMPEMTGSGSEALKHADDVSSATQDSTSSALYLSFAVQDTGSGIKPEYLDRLFERFTQGSIKTHVKYGGSGLAVRGNHLLLVEDNLVNQKVMAKLLRRLGYVVALANHGQEALDYLATTKLYQVNGDELDLILMDIEMPVMNGLDCVREIRKLESRTSGMARLPIVAVTANARKAQQDMALANGFDAVITKPFQTDDLQSFGLERMYCHAIEYVRAKDSGTPVGQWVAELVKKDPWFKDLMPNFRVLTKDQVPAGYDGGSTFTSVCINTALYLPWLASQCLKHGVKIKRGIIRHITEATRLTHDGSPADIVVNCTGLSSLFLGGVEDKTLYPGRGQITLVSNDPGAMIGTTGTDDFPEEMTYIMHRAAGGGTVIGGCLQADKWESQPDMNMATRIMQRAIEVCPALVPEGKGIEGLQVIRHAVGLRPMRKDGIRVELEMVTGGGRRVPIVHNYGHGGYGYQTSWGAAEEAKRLVENAMGSRAKL
ncbi:hypothetical protein AMS68_005078 [Peltaster fructicola]|uniref:Response regulatory domain-containing protein n=1 Tax=Peltaster fructicola TaxID=286661 RepID=A0A6H0XY18_9PEZI|nr:hypothetical protein AMS68_005078 [Peltaster fructicola]